MGARSAKAARQAADGARGRPRGGGSVVAAHGGLRRPRPPSIGQCITCGLGWLEVECNRCKTRVSLALDSIRRPRDTPICPATCAPVHASRLLQKDTPPGSKCTVPSAPVFKLDHEIPVADYFAIPVPPRFDSLVIPSFYGHKRQARRFTLAGQSFAEFLSLFSRVL